MRNDEIHYKLLKLLEMNPELSQRQLASELGFSVGKLNYCLKALIDKGWVKVDNFRNSQNKVAYLYLLTPRGIEEKTRVTARFLKHKLAELETLKQDIEILRREFSHGTSVASESESR